MNIALSLMFVPGPSFSRSFSVKILQIECTSLAKGIFKRDFMIDKQIESYFVQYSKCLSNPPSLYAIQIIKHYLNSMISANHEKGEVFQPYNGKILIPCCSSIVESLFNFHIM